MTPRPSRRAFVGSAAAALAAGSAPLRASAQKAPDVVRISLNISAYSNLPLFLALDSGYFARRQLDVRVTPYTGSSLTQLPMLGRGDLDVTAVAPAPGLFNLSGQGFNVKVVASLSGAHPGWNGTCWMIVRQDLWDAGKIRKPADLRGMHVDVAQPGSPNDLVARETLRLGGLTPADVNLTSAVRLPESWYVALRNKAVDVQVTIEPYATQIQQEGLGHKWISYNESVPWFQDIYLAASPAFARDQHAVLTRFLTAYLQAAQEINKAGPTWTPALAALAAKWSQVPLATITQIPGPTYTGDLGAINVSSLERVRQFWLNEGLVKTADPVGSLLDLSALTEARKALRIR